MKIRAAAFVRSSVHPLVCSLLCAFAPAVLNAQTNELTRFGHSSVALEVMRAAYPDNNGGQEFSAGTLTYFLSAQTTLRPGARLLVDLPYSHMCCNGLTNLSSSAFGNPYVGIQVEHKALTFDVGGRLPVYKGTDGLAGFLGFQVDIDRQEAFFENVGTLRARVAVRSTSPSGLSFGASAGPALQMDTKPDPDGEDNTIMLSYGGDVGYRKPEMRLGARLAGRADLSISGTWGSRSYHQAGLFGDFGTGNVRPGFQLSIPIGVNARGYTSWVLGLNVTGGDV